MIVRTATDEDWAAIWPFYRRIVAAQDTLPYDPDPDEPTARAGWMVDRTSVAVDDSGRVIGTANMYANRAGPGAHVASGTFLVDPDHWGQGAGRALCEDALAWAGDQGFRAMQFNAVVETNERAVALYRSLGFEIAGTVPEAFLHPAHGYVGLHVMYRPLGR